MNGHRDDDVPADDGESFPADGDSATRYSGLPENLVPSISGTGMIVAMVPEAPETVRAPTDTSTNGEEAPPIGTKRSKKWQYIFKSVVVIVLGIVIVVGFLVFGRNQDDPSTNPPVVVTDPDQSGVPTVPTGSTTGPTPGPGVGSTPAPAVVVEPTPSPTLAPTRPSIPGGTIMPTTTIERSFTLNSFINGGQSLKCGIQANDMAGFVSRDSGNPEGFEVDLVSALTVVGDQSFTKQPLEQ